MNQQVDNMLDQAFAWFTGVVEDVADPMQMGRVRVRCIGYHTDNRSDIPVSSLPWANVMMPVNSASMSGIGISATGILPGSWVVGFFRDGRSAQDPIVLGTIPTKTSKGDTGRGFTDPSGKYPLQDGGYDIPPEAREEDYENTDSYANRLNAAAITAKVASVPDLVTGALEKSDDLYWTALPDEAEIAPKYPKNQVYHSESGHVREIDDTPGAERTLNYHKSGTHEEVFASGKKNTVIVGSNYTVVLEDNYIYVKGDCNLTVDGGMRTYVKGTYVLEVDGDKVEYIKGNRYSRVEQMNLDDVYENILSTETAALIGYKPDIGDGQGVTGIELRHPGVYVSGNLHISSGADGSFTSADSKQVTVANGVVTVIEST